MKRKASPVKLPKKSPISNTVTADDLATSVKLLTLQPGVYMLAVSSTGAAPARLASGVRLPAITVSLAPGMPPDRIEFLSSPSVSGHWVSSKDDLLIVKVLASVTVAVTSMRGPNQAELNASFEKLGVNTIVNQSPRIERTTSAAPTTETESQKKYQRAPGELPISVLAHIRGRGDVNFSDMEWAGKIGQGNWIESFAVTPTEGLGAQDVEYKALTASGFESPWQSNSQPCGTRGMSIPIVGFAMRLKSEVATASYDFEYSGYFQSGTTVGPLRNGAPCQSTIANDPLEGIQIKIIRKGHKVSSSEAAIKSATKKASSSTKGSSVKSNRPAKTKASLSKSERASTNKGLLARFRKK